MGRLVQRKAKWNQNQVKLKLVDPIFFYYQHKQTRRKGIFCKNID
jgi:hypothetical protein